jgi:hypothetical protein
MKYTVIVALDSFALFSGTSFASFMQCNEKKDLSKFDSASYSCALYFAVSRLKIWIQTSLSVLVYKKL